MRIANTSPVLRRVLLSSAAVAALAWGAPSWAITYEYDALGRLTKITYDDGKIVQYQYDAAGNRTIVTGT